MKTDAEVQPDRQDSARVAEANLSSSAISSVHSGQMIAADGEEMVRIKIVLTPGSTDKLQGYATLNTLVEIQDELEKAGEERYPVIEYAEDELKTVGSSRP